MTRIIAGEWRGHPLPKLMTGSVRPTTDRARTILFDTLRDVTEFSVLDLYSGTGALGFEALSRGANSLVSIDNNRNYIDSQKEWILSHAKPFKSYVGDVETVLLRLEDKYDLIFADPPYAEGLPIEVLSLIESHSTPDTILVFESARRSNTLLESDIFTLVKQKEVAETRIQIYKADKL